MYSVQPTRKRLFYISTCPPVSVIVKAISRRPLRWRVKITRTMVVDFMTPELITSRNALITTKTRLHHPRALGSDRTIAFHIISIFKNNFYLYDKNKIKNYTLLQWFLIKRSFIKSLFINQILKTLQLKL